MTLRATDLPLLLTSTPNWVGWRSELRPGAEKATKIPYDLVTGQKARTNDPTTWCSFEEAIRRTADADYDGLGFVFTKDLGIVGIDLDDCFTGDGRIKTWAAAKLSRFNITYQEISPSGKGVKIFARGKLPGSGKKVFINAAGEPVKEGSPDVEGACEMYDWGRFFTVTGNACGPLDVADCQDAINALYASLVRSDPVERTAAADDAEVVAEGGRHAYLLSRGGQWRNAGMDREGIFEGLRKLNQQKCQPPKSEYELKGIVDWLMRKPPKYRLTPRDFDDSRRVVNGEPEATAAPDAPTDTTEAINAIGRAETLMEAIITARTPEAIYGADFINALAAAGTIKQHESKRRLKAAFGKDFSVKEWESRIQAAEAILRRDTNAFTDYLVTSTGAMAANVANAITMMQPIKVAWNAFNCCAFLIEKSPWGTTGNWTDHDDTGAADWCQHKHLNVDENVIAKASTYIARCRLPWHHPVVEYLRALAKWDGIPRLDHWLSRFLGVTSNEYVRNVAAKWMISGVKRVHEPGCQADYTLVLEGGQGKRKSTALRVLAGDDWFSDDLMDIGSKDSAIQLQGKWIIEVSELDAVRRAEMTTVKAWLVRRHDFFRPPYGRRSANFPRQNIFAATTNKSEWLTDDTGGRRFWPVRVGEKIDIDGLKAVRDQLWAEAVVRYDRGELPYFTDPVEKLAQAEQHERQDTDAWRDLVEVWIRRPVPRGQEIPIYSSPGHVYLPDILWHCLSIAEPDWSPSHKFRVGRILTLAGYQCEREAEEDGRRLDYWILPRK